MNEIVYQQPHGILATGRTSVVPSLIAREGERAASRYVEFFTAFRGCGIQKSRMAGITRGMSW